MHLDNIRYAELTAQLYYLNHIDDQLVSSICNETRLFRPSKCGFGNGRTICTVCEMPAYLHRQIERMGKNDSSSWNGVTQELGAGAPEWTKYAKWLKEAKVKISENCICCQRNILVAYIGRHRTAKRTTSPTNLHVNLLYWLRYDDGGTNTHPQTHTYIQWVSVSLCVSVCLYGKQTVENK